MFSKYVFFEKKIFKSHSLRQKFLTKERGATEKGGNGHSRVPLDTLMLHCNCSPEMFENLFGASQALERTTEFTIFIKFHNKIKRLCAFFISLNSIVPRIRIAESLFKSRKLFTDYTYDNIQMI